MGLCCFISFSLREKVPDRADEGVAMPIPPELLIFARELRKKQTDAENLLWQVLRGRRFCGFKFRRQCPMHGYILDFYCHEAGLAVELDGGGHNEEEQRQYDEERTKILEAAGIHVVRFWNNDVLSNTEIVLEKLHTYLEEESAR
jgi:very-short-patch-repair endonuclease